MPRRHDLLKTLSKNWFSKLDPDEVSQEELIQSWKNPDIKGYEGLAAYKELLYSKIKESKISSREEPIKKDTPDLTSKVSLVSLAQDLIQEADLEIRGLLCIALQPIFQEVYYGVDITTVRKQGEKLGMSKAAISRIKQTIRKFGELTFSN